MRCEALHPDAMQTVCGRDEKTGKPIISKQRVRCWHGSNHEGRHGEGAITWYDDEIPAANARQAHGASGESSICSEHSA